MPVALAACLLLNTLAPLPALAGPYEMGLRLYEQGNYELAAPYFQKATAQDNTNPNAHYYLADTFLRMNKLAEAQAEYQKILALAPDSQAARMSRVGLSHLRGYLNGKAHTEWQLSSVAGSKGEDRFSGGYGKDDYYEAVTPSSKVTRWAITEMPLKIYIERSPEGIRNFQPAFTNQVQKALEVWATAMNHQLSYTLVNDKEAADIRVRWVNTIDTKGHSADGGTAYTAGLMLPKVQDDVLKHADVQIATFDILGNPQNSEIIYAVAIHELGHSFGLLGHSDDPGDIMYAQNQNIARLSVRDTNTIRHLYSSDADVNNLPVATRKNDPKRKEQIAQALDSQIAKAEALAKADPTALVKLNLGVVYFQKGKLRQAKGGNPKPGSDADPDYWMKKSLAATDESIKMEPDDARAFHKRSLANQELRNIPQALTDIERAITLDRKEPEYYMLRSWYHAKLGHVAESRAALSYYLQTSPESAGSADVKLIQGELAKLTSK